jgi:hypothetical protein
MDIKSMSLQEFLLEVYKQLQLEQVTFEAFKRMNSIVVIRSASLEIFEKFIVKIRERNPNIYLYVITHSRDKESVIKLCIKNYEIIEYCEDGIYQSNKMEKQTNYLKNKSIDASILLYNNRYGMGFDNVEDILISLGKKPIYAFNCYKKLFRIDNPTLHIESLRIFNAMCTWFWEYMGSTEERNA